MKACIVTRTGDREASSQSTRHMRLLRSSFDAMNIRHGRRMIADGAVFSAAEAAAVSAEYDFIVIPNFSAGFGNFVDDSNITIPIFGIGADSGMSLIQFGATDSGLTGSPVARAYQFLDTPWSASSYIAARCASYQLSGATAIATVSATNPIDGSAQTNAGRAVAWKHTNTAGVNLYISCLSEHETPVFPLLLQGAINDGVVVVDSSLRKAPMFFDLDHIQGSYTIAEPEILDVIASYIPSGGTVWCGLTNGTLGLETQDVISRLLTYQAQGKFKFCWHDHDLVPTIGTNIGPDGYSTDHTKQTIYDKYKLDEAAWNAMGIYFDFPAYNNPGSDAWDESCLELYSSETARTSSPGNDTVQAGFGFKAFRHAAASSSRASYTGALIGYNAHKTMQKVRGILLTWGIDNALNSSLPYNTAEKMTPLFRNIMQTMICGASIYLHDEDFQRTLQEPGVAQQGDEMIRMFADVGAYMRDIAKPFANPVDYVA